MVQWLRLCAPNAGGLGSIPDQGTRPHMLQLTILCPSTKKKKIPCAATKTRCNQVNKCFLNSFTQEGCSQVWGVSVLLPGEALVPWGQLRKGEEATAPSPRGVTPGGLALFCLPFYHPSEILFWSSVKSRVSGASQSCASVSLYHWDNTGASWVDCCEASVSDTRTGSGMREACVRSPGIILRVSCPCVHQGSPNMNEDPRVLSHMTQHFCS